MLAQSCRSLGILVGKDIEAIEKIKAHQDPSEREPLSESWFQAKENEVADKWAKEGAGLHSLPDASERERHRKRAGQLKKCLRLVGSTLPLVASSCTQ